MERYRQAQTREEHRAVALEYKTFFDTLDEEAQAKAQEVMNVLWPDIKQNVDELERLTEQIESVLKSKVAWENKD